MYEYARTRRPRVVPGRQVSARTNLTILGCGAFGNNNKFNLRDSKDHSLDIALSHGLMVQTAKMCDRLSMNLLHRSRRTLYTIICSK